MKMSDITAKEKYKGKKISTYIGGLTGRSIPPELHKIAKHIKTFSNGTKYIIRYDDDWYRRMFKNEPDVVDFDSFYKKLKPYFTTTRII